MKKLSYLFAALAIVLSDIMCFVVAYYYREMICCVEHTGCSAPPCAAFLYSVPFIVGIIVCVVLAIIFYKKSK